MLQYLTMPGAFMVQKCGFFMRFVASLHRRNSVLIIRGSKLILWAITLIALSTSALNCGSALSNDTPSAFARSVVIP